MNILVTNDDGILAPGLALLADACRAVGPIIVSATDPLRRASTGP